VLKIELSVNKILVNYATYYRFAVWQIINDVRALTLSNGGERMSQPGRRKFKKP
jgi:hypothetical protein